MLKFGIPTMKYSITVFVTFITALLTVLLAGCGGREIGHGVILWPDSEAVEAGQIVPIVETSTVQDSYIIRLPDAAAHQLPRWRVQFFDSQEDATAFAARYQEVAALYVRSERTALPVRESLDRTSRTVYRLRFGEESKVLERSAEPHDEAGLVAHWYRVLTANGTSGWVFGYYLTAFSEDEDLTPAESEVIEDPVVRALLEEVWRPSHYAQMIRSNTIDLARLRPEHGLFPNPDENRLSLVLPDRRIDFDYSEIVRSAARQYAASGTSLQIAVRNERAITIQYIHDNQTESVDLEIIEQDIEELRTAEIERRDELYLSLLERGDLWQSSAYGTIRLAPDRRFEWTGYGSLVPTVIPRGAGNSGRVEFAVFLERQLRSSFDGVISFRFAGLDHPVHFLYNRIDTGIRLTHLPQQSVTRNVVSSPGASAIVAFFSMMEADRAAAD
ncbi:MAG: SH3 domain-containing protein [Spirochaetaceae bacterium]|nr:MAG: SH3 domain-containing protein [Spirochaetaceae bacterium]